MSMKSSHFYLKGLQLTMHDIQRLAVENSGQPIFGNHDYLQFIELM